LGASEWQNDFKTHGKPSITRFLDKIEGVNKLTPRARTFLFAGIALLALVLLAASLNVLELSPGKPLAYTYVAPNLVDPGVSPGTMEWLLAIFRVLMIIGWILFPIYIIMLFISKDERKRFLRFLASILPFLIILYIMANNRSSQEVVEDLTPRVFGDLAPQDFAPSGAAPPEFVPPPAWVTTFTTIAVAVVVSLLVIGVFYAIWRRSKERARLREPLKKVERQAQAALNAIRAGGDLGEAIVRCYIQMMDALKEYRGISRDQDMTPHEFELFLDRQGVPVEPVHQLTSLFEEVRYSTFKPGRNDEATAIASLSAIVSACQRAAERRR